MLRGNLFQCIVEPGSAEASSTLIERKAVRVERIVSHGHASPPGFWYDQDEHEFVVVVSGSAELEIEGRGVIRLTTGDWLEIPAHVRHRVTWTDPTTDTIWLAVFYS
jgi:cupin 2 domain-containing protein